MYVYTKKVSKEMKNLLVMKPEGLSQIYEFLKLKRYPQICLIGRVSFSFIYSENLMILDLN